MCTFIKDLCNRFERLLASRVPNLKLEHLLLKSDHERAELDAYGHFVVHYELISSDPMHQTTLAYGRVTDYDQLEE